MNLGRKDVWMKILIIGNRERYEKFGPGKKLPDSYEIVCCPVGGGDEELLRSAGDADVVLADAIASVSGYVIEHMPNLKMIHSEGVAYNKIDVSAADKRNIYVCNNKGGNAGAVAEQAVLLMLGLLRTVVSGHNAVMEGRQLERKEALMVSGITDLADCKIGILGFGDIGRETAKRLRAFGCTCFYYTKNRKSSEIEDACGAVYRPLEKLLAECDIISLHMAVQEETTGFMDRKRIAQMKEGAYLVNTGRGELVDNQALCEALKEGRLAGAGLDTVFPEPVREDNPLVKLAKAYPGKILFSPHIGGVTTGSFKRMHRHMWENVRRIENGQQPDCIVNKTK